MDDKTQGTANEVKGKAEQAWGDLTDNPDDEAEGQATETKGRYQQAAADLKNAVQDVTDDNS